MGPALHVGFFQKKGPWLLTFCLLTMTPAVSTLSYKTNTGPKYSVAPYHIKSLQVQRYTIYVLLVFPNAKFKSVLLHGQLVSC